MAFNPYSPTWQAYLKAKAEHDAAKRAKELAAYHRKERTRRLSAAYEEFVGRCVCGVLVHTVPCKLEKRQEQDKLEAARAAKAAEEAAAAAKAAQVARRSMRAKRRAKRRGRRKNGPSRKGSSR